MGDFKASPRIAEVITFNSIFKENTMHYKTAFFLFGAILLENAFKVAPAFAYLDPGTGSMLLQALMAGFVAIGVTAGIYWRRIKNFFTRNKKDN